MIEPKVLLQGYKKQNNRGILHSTLFGMIPSPQPNKLNVHSLKQQIFLINLGIYFTFCEKLDLFL
jgi:hypothetical protein